MRRCTAGRALICLLAIISTLAISARAADRPTGRYAAQLEAECNELTSRAIRRGYGWAWDAGCRGESGATRRPTSRPVDMQPMGTPAAALVLLWSGQLLGQPRFVDAAEQACRGVVAAQVESGKVPAVPSFAPSTAGGREEPVITPDRGSTRAAIGLLLALGQRRTDGQMNDEPATTRASPEASPSRPDSRSAEASSPRADATSAATSPSRLDSPSRSDPPSRSDSPARSDASSHTDSFSRGAARRAAGWLMKQQTKSGGFVSTWPPDATSHQAQQIERLIRLDSSDYRDCTLALLLAGDVLGDKPTSVAARRAIDQLLALQISNPRERGNGLWIGAYTPAAEPRPTLIGLRGGPDVLASRYAMQTLLGGYLITGDRSLGGPIDLAVKSLQNLRRPDLQWDRFPDHPDSDTPAAAPAPSTQPLLGVATTTQPLETPLTTAGDFGLPQLFHAITQLKTIGRDRFITLTDGQIGIRQQIEAALVGLDDDVLALDFPTSAADADAWLAKHADLWHLIDGPPPEALADRVRRLWALYLRARVEQLR